MVVVAVAGSSEELEAPAMANMNPWRGALLGGGGGGIVGEGRGGQTEGLPSTTSNTTRG